MPFFKKSTDVTDTGNTAENKDVPAPKTKNLGLIKKLAILGAFVGFGYAADAQQKPSDKNFADSAKVTIEVENENVRAGHSEDGTDFFHPYNPLIANQWLQNGAGKRTFDKSVTQYYSPNMLQQNARVHQSHGVTDYATDGTSNFFQADYGIGQGKRDANIAINRSNVNVNDSTEEFSLYDNETNIRVGGNVLAAAMKNFCIGKDVGRVGLMTNTHVNVGRTNAQDVFRHVSAGARSDINMAAHMFGGKKIGKPAWTVYGGLAVEGQSYPAATLHLGGQIGGTTRALFSNFNLEGGAHRETFLTGKKHGKISVQLEDFYGKPTNVEFFVEHIEDPYETLFPKTTIVGTEASFRLGEHTDLHIGATHQSGEGTEKKNTGQGFGVQVGLEIDIK